MVKTCNAVVKSSRLSSSRVRGACWCRWFTTRVTYRQKHPLIESFKTEMDQLHLNSSNINTAPVHLNNCSFFQSIHCKSDVISIENNDCQKQNFRWTNRLPCCRFVGLTYLLAITNVLHQTNSPMADWKRIPDSLNHHEVLLTTAASAASSATLTHARTHFTQAAKVEAPGCRDWAS